MIDKLLFDRVNDNLYIVKNPQNVLASVRKALNELTIGDPLEYEESTTAQLFSAMVSRRVVSEFFANGNVLPNTGFVQIIVPAGSNDINCIAGNIKINNVLKKTSGVLYK